MSKYWKNARLGYGKNSSLFMLLVTVFVWMMKLKFAQPTVEFYSVYLIESIYWFETHDISLYYAFLIWIWQMKKDIYQDKVWKWFSRAIWLVYQ